MANQALNYAPATQGHRRSILATIALVCCATAGALILVGFIDGTSDTEFLGFLSFPMAVVGTLLGVVAIMRSRSRTRQSRIAVIISLAYWVFVACIAVPKLLAMRHK